MNETKPLLPATNGTGVSLNGGAKHDITDKPKSFLRSKLLGISLVGVGVLIGSSFGPSISTTTIATFPLPSTINIPESTSKIRSSCTIHGNRLKSAGVLQTSIGNPSQQWSSIPCFASDDDSIFDINSYGSPDAILRTDLGRTVFPDRQPIVGFGAAFTEAASLNYQSLSDEGKERLMELFFGKTGLGYSMGRVPLNSCDFSVKSYSFDEVDGDFDLEHFDTKVTHDAQKDGMIDMILRATALFNKSWKGEDDAETDGVKDGNFKMFASPWSPPKWMKVPTHQSESLAGFLHAKNMSGSAEPSCLREGTGRNSTYAKTWALYMSKFVTAYQSYGVPLGAVTVQNEPEFPAPWEACSYTPEVMADFIGYHLGPQFEKDHPDVQIYMFDHNKDHLVTWAKTILNETHSSSKYVSGSAYHWYAGGMDRLLDGAVGSPNMHRMQSELKRLNVPNDHLVFNSEACHCPYTAYGGGDIEVAWYRAERYAHAMLGDLMAGSNGWVEWNLVLDGVGGPNHLHNLCDATILAVPHRALGSTVSPTLDWEKTNASGRFGPSVGDGRTREELNAFGFPAKHLDVGLAVQPMYYYMGHISRYVRPGSRAVKGLVDSAKDGYRAFRSPEEDVAGGGINDLARNGVELTAWPCEGSTRQKFHWRAEEQHIMVNGHDWRGFPTESCVANVTDPSFLGVTLTECGNEATWAGIFEMIEEADSDYVRFHRTTGNHAAGTDQECLILKRLENEGGAYGPRGGAQIDYGHCDNPAARWLYSETTDEIISNYMPEGPVCMTTGWPFLQIGAFETPNGESANTVVLLNEARDSANYVLYDGDDLILSGSIPPRSIQTLLLD